jgi:bile acid:Na+ symporter, BASS family
LSKIENLFSFLSNAFPLWVVIGAALALWKPETATWFQPDWIPFFLGIIMLSMGLTLKLEDFKRIIKTPKLVIIGVILQYTIMPMAGWALAKLFNLSPDFAIGLILVASCPGGTASNVVCFIAKANVALSVSLTTVSTLVAVFATPLLTTFLIKIISQNMEGGEIEVNTLGLLVNTLKVVILPVTIGILLNRLFPNIVNKITPFTPFLAVLSIVFIVDFILAVKKDAILQTGGNLVLAILMLHTFGFGIGYVASKFLGLCEKNKRTISIEVGMQNSGLATELARNNFPSFALATVPGAISALTHCILGSIVAGTCLLFPKK